MRTRFFGHFLLSQGIITASQLLEAVEYQNQRNSRLGELAVAIGLVTHSDADRINALQSREDLLFGEAAIKLGLMDQGQVEQLLTTQREGHVHLGQALVSLGYLNDTQLAVALERFRRHESESRPTLNLPPDWSGAPLLARMTELAPRLLLRTWDLQSKLDDLRVEADDMLLSDLNTKLELEVEALGIEAEHPLVMLVGVPYAAAHKAASRRASDGRPDDDDLRGLVGALSETLARQLISVVAERGHRLVPGSSARCGERIAVPNGQQGISAPFLTHVGTVVIALIA